LEDLNKTMIKLMEKFVEVENKQRWFFYKSA
jgi:hypothetical protein